MTEVFITTDDMFVGLTNWNVTTGLRGMGVQCLTVDPNNQRASFKATPYPALSLWPWLSKGRHWRT